MKIGGVYFFTDRGPEPVQFAQAMESEGFESLWFPEHTHFPASRETDYPEAYGGGELPWFYLRTWDQMVTLAYIAAATTTLRIGSGAMLLAQRDPIAMAKQIATLDQFSGGRYELALGLGWNREEAEAHGVNWKKRFSTVRDKAQALRALWRGEGSTRSGAVGGVKASGLWPKPAPEGGPAIWLGGAGPTTFRHVAQWADGLYIVPPPNDPTLEATLPEFWRIVEEEGRDPKTVRVAVASAPPELSVLEKYREQGVERASLWIDPTDPAEAYPNMQAAAKVMHEFNA